MKPDSFEYFITKNMSFEDYIFTCFSEDFLKDKFYMTLGVNRGESLLNYLLDESYAHKAEFFQYISSDIISYCEPIFEYLISFAEYGYAGRLFVFKLGDYFISISNHHDEIEFEIISNIPFDFCLKKCADEFSFVEIELESASDLKINQAEDYKDYYSTALYWKFDFLSYAYKKGKLTANKLKYYRELEDRIKLC